MTVTAATAKLSETDHNTARAPAQLAKQQKNNSDLTNVERQRAAVTLPVWW